MCGGRGAGGVEEHIDFHADPVGVGAGIGVGVTEYSWLGHPI